MGEIPRCEDCNGHLSSLPLDGCNQPFAHHRSSDPEVLALDSILDSDLGRERGDAHPLLDQRPGGAFFTGDLLALLDRVLNDRHVDLWRDGDKYHVALLDDDQSTAEEGQAGSLDEALRYALGAYLD